MTFKRHSKGAEGGRTTALSGEQICFLLVLSLPSVSPVNPGESVSIHCDIGPPHPAGNGMLIKLGAAQTHPGLSPRLFCRRRRRRLPPESQCTPDQISAFNTKPAEQQQILLDAIVLLEVKIRSSICRPRCGEFKTLVKPFFKKCAGII